MPLAILFGLLLLVSYIIYLRATLRSVGPFGMGLGLAIVATLPWVLYDLGWHNHAYQSFNLWLGLIALSLVLGIGLSWNHVRRVLSFPVRQIWMTSMNKCIG